MTEKKKLTPLAIVAWVIGSILGGGVGLTVIAMALQFWISVEVAAQLKENGVVPKHEITKIEDNVAVNAGDIDAIETRWNALVDALAAQRADP